MLILGGGGRQLLPLIQAAKNEGYYVILVGNIKKNPGIDICDKHYEEDCTNLAKVMEIAKKEQIDGVLGNAEYAMKYVAAVAEELGLIGNTRNAVATLNSKYKFRQICKECGLYTPKSFLTESFDKVLEIAEKEAIRFPIIIKPEVCSASRGTTIIRSFKEIKKAKVYWDICRDFSSSRKVVVEEFLEMESQNNILDGDIFVHNGHILWNGLFSSKHSEKAPLFPMTQSYPLNLSDKRRQEIKEALTRIIEKAEVTYGALNIEGFYTNTGKLFFIEINARQGGNGIPYMIKKHCDIDYCKLLVTTAVGDDTYFDEVVNSKHCGRIVSRQQCFWHAEADLSNGIYEGLNISSEIKPFITNIEEFLKVGNIILPAKKGTDYVALVDLEFDTMERQFSFVKDIEKHIYPKVRINGN